MSKYITNLNLPLLQYSLCPIGDLIAPSTNDTLATGYLSHQIGLVKQNDYPLQLGFKASIFKEDFLNTRVTQTSTPSARISQYPAIDSLHLVTSYVSQVSTMSQVYPNILSSLWCPYIL